MRRAVNLCVLSSVIFMILLAAVPYIAAFGTALYIAAYASVFFISATVTLLIARGGKMRSYGLSLSIDREGAAFSLPLAIPAISLTVLLSALTSYLLEAAGLSGAQTLQGGAVFVILVYVLIPAVGEEILFRYIPINLIAPHSARGAILVSALIFSAVHANLFQLPYAFFAGAVFAFLDISTKSILPSMAVHMLNNALSVVLSLYTGGAVLAATAAVLAALCALSALAVTFRFKVYKDKIKEINSHGGRVFTVGLAVFLCIALLLACAAAF